MRRKTCTASICRLPPGRGERLSELNSAAASASPARWAADSVSARIMGSKVVETACPVPA
jgi:hypothetical protein